MGEAAEKPERQREMAMYERIVAARGEDWLKSALLRMRPEAAREIREHFGWTIPPWEEHGMTRATYYRNRDMLSAAYAGGRYDEVIQALQSGTTPAEIRRQLGIGPVNSPTARARSAMKGVTGTAELVALLGAELARRGGDTLTEDQRAVLLVQMMDAPIRLGLIDPDTWNDLT